MSITIQRKPGTALAQTVHIRSHQLDADVSVAEGGADEGPSPHDLYDAAVGACKALTVMWFAKKKGIAVDDIRTEVTSDASQERAGVYRITSKLVISGGVQRCRVCAIGGGSWEVPRTQTDDCRNHRNHDPGGARSMSRRENRKINCYFFDSKIRIFYVT